MLGNIGNGCLAETGTFAPGLFSAALGTVLRFGCTVPLVLHGCSHSTNRSFGLVDPGILPSCCHRGEVATDPDDRTSARAELQGVMLREWQCQCPSHAGVPGSIVIVNAIRACGCDS